MDCTCKMWFMLRAAGGVELAATQMHRMHDVTHFGKKLPLL